MYMQRQEIGGTESTEASTWIRESIGSMNNLAPVTARMDTRR